MIDQVTPHRLFKLFLVYENPWWKGQALPGGETGQVITDLPIRQVYYFGPAWSKRHARDNWIYEIKDTFEDNELTRRGIRRKFVKEGNKFKYVEGTVTPLSLIMASYSDDHYVGFWDPLEQDDLPRYPVIYSDLLSKPANDRLEEIKKKCGPSDRMVQKVLHQLAELHGTPIPPPIASIYMDWGRACGTGSWGGWQGWHTWNASAKPWESLRNALRVQHESNLYICGEAYSRDQGWVEGGLKSAEWVIHCVASLNCKLEKNKDYKINPPDFWSGVGVKRQETEPKGETTNFSEYIQMPLTLDELNRMNEKLAPHRIQPPID